MEEKQIEEKTEEKMPSGNNSILIWVALIVVAVIIGAALLLRGGNESDLQQAPITTPLEETGDATEGTEPDEPMEEQDAVVFDITGRPFEFSVKEIRVNKGDRVRIDFTSAQGMHNWTIDEFNAATGTLQAGQSDSVEFVADEAGSFEYYCSVANHRQLGMVGDLIVE